MIFFSESGEKNHKNYELTIFCAFVLTKPQNVVYNDYTTKNTATRNTEEKRKMKVIKRNGAEMQFAPGKDGMIHISRMSDKRVESVEDVLSIGDMVKVEIIKIGEKGIDFKLLEKM